MHTSRGSNKPALKKINKFRTIKIKKIKSALPDAPSIK